MRGAVFHRYATGTALVLLLTGAAGTAWAAPANEAAIQAAIPVPEPANVPPPTIDSIAPKPATTATAPDAAKPQAPSSQPASQPASQEPTPAAAATTPTSREPAASDPASAPKNETAKSEPAAPALGAADQAIADQLKAQIGGKSLASVFDRKSEREAVEAFYTARNFAPLWLENGAASPRAKAAIARLKAADQDGLDPADYAAPDFAGATDPESLARADLRLTDAVLTYARHAYMGRVSYTRVSADIAYPKEAPAPADILDKVANAPDVAAIIGAYNPTHPGYLALKAKLAELRGKTDDAPAVVRIPDGKLLRPGDSDPRVVLLRKRLNVTTDPSSEKFDDAVAAAVKAFQGANNLPQDGVVGPKTISDLNGGPSPNKTIDIVLANMERWRWLPRHLGAPELGNAYVMLNIPDFTLKVMREGKMVWTTRVVTGKPNTPTPLLTETMKYITVNPTWNVPPSIVYNEYLPALQQDPTVLDRMGLKLSQNRDGSVHISQPPGERNALGRIRFNFPNKFLVYQHDTPDKHLFAKDERAYSHGCMRVQNPDKYAEVLLGITLPKENYTAEKIRSMYGRSEQNINLPTPIPVHITYQTAFIDDSGALQLRKDIYGRDAKTIALLTGDERKVADIPVERAQPSYSRPSVRLPNGVAIAGDNWNNGPSFFERLFGVAPADPAPQSRKRKVYTR